MRDVEVVLKCDRKGRTEMNLRFYQCQKRKVRSYNRMGKEIESRCDYVEIRITEDDHMFLEKEYPRIRKLLRALEVH